MYNPIEAQFEIQLDYKDIPSDFIVTDGLVHSVTVRLRGPSLLLRSIPKESLKRSISLANIKKGVTIVPMPAVEFTGRYRSFKLVDIQPSHLEVRADLLIERTVQVSPTAISHLRRGALTVSDLEVKPNAVTLRGPESIVSTIGTLRLPVPVDATSEADSITTKVMTLDTPKFVTAIPATVTVKYKMTSGRVSLTRNCRLEIATNTPQDYTVSPASIELSVEVPEALARSNAYLSGLKVVVSPPPDLQPGSSRMVPVRIRTPEGMTLSGATNRQVLITRKAVDPPAPDTASQVHQTLDQRDSRLLLKEQRQHDTDKSQSAKEQRQRAEPLQK